MWVGEYWTVICDSFEISIENLRMNNIPICPFSLVFLYPHMFTKMKPTNRYFNVPVLQIFFLSSLLCLYVEGYGDECDIHCLQTIKKLDTLNRLSSWDFENITEGDICSRFSGVECANYMGGGVIINLGLSNMGLTGQFPSCIENFTWLQSLDFSNNNFYGEIPKGIAKISYLNILRLDGNHLSGQIPQELGLLSRIRVFSVANNLLTGPVPVFKNNIDVSLSYANNSGLCGGLLGSCEEEKEESLFDRSFWYSFLIGFVSSATGVLVAFMYHYAPLTEFKKRTKAIYPLRVKQNHQKDTRQVAELLPLALQEQRSKELSRLLERLIPRMSFMELCKATDYFSANNILGLGTTGIMYKAKVPNNCFLAVKRVYDGDRYKREFLLETVVPGRHKHRNIVPLYGFCIEKNERILVYKYMPNGRLSDWLHSDEGQETRKLLWPERIHIALGLARGLSWLHKKCKMLHLNLNSDCVMLDKNFEPKISNFGKAKFINHMLEDEVRVNLFLIDGLGVKGCIKRDVYDFGIILFELITGKRLTDSFDSADSSLMKYITNSLFTDPVDFYDAVDKCILGKGFDNKILGLLEVACECVKGFSEQRQEMVDMYKTIRGMCEGYEALFDMDSPDQILCSNQIECIG